MSWKFVNDLTQRLRCTLRATYATGTTLATMTNVTPFNDLGNVIDGGISPAGEPFEDFSSEAGKKVLESIEFIRDEHNLKVKLNELTKDTIKRLLKGDDGTSIAQAPIGSATAIDSMDFSVTPGVIGKIYYFTSSGARIYNVLTASLDEGLTPLNEGTDYELLPEVGGIIAKKAFADTVSVEVTTSGLTVTPIKLVRDSVETGIIQIEIWAPKYSKTRPRAIITADVFFDTNEELALALESHPEPILNMRTRGEPLLIDFAAAT